MLRVSWRIPFSIRIQTLELCVYVVTNCFIYKVDFAEKKLIAYLLHVQCISITVRSLATKPELCFIQSSQRVFMFQYNLKRQYG